MMQEEKNIGQLARDTASDLTSIAGKEIRLASVELQENMTRAVKGFGETLAGAAILIPAATVGLIAIGFGLGTIDGLADWVAFLIVAAIAGLGGYLMMKAGKDALDLSKLFPTKTAENLRRDAQTVKEATR